MRKLRDVITRYRTRQAARAALPTATRDEIVMSDRGAPAWTRGLSFVFTTLSSFSLLGVAVLAVFMHSLVAQGGNLLLAWLLGLAGIVPVLGALIMDFAHARALSGYRYQRIANEHAARAGIAGLCGVVLCLVHPLLGLGVLIGGGIGWLASLAMRRFSRREPLWDFRRSEAVGILAGRDTYGHTLANSDAQSFAMWRSVRQAAIWLAIVFTMAAGSWLAARDIISLAAIGGIVLIVLWSVGALCDHAELSVRDKMTKSDLAHRVERTQVLEEADEDVHSGLRIRGLSVDDMSGKRLLSDVHLDIPPGTILGLRGDAGSGKSLLLAALSDPHGLAGLSLRGHITLNDHDLWARQAEHEQVPCVLLSETPVLLAASGAENLACFQVGPLLERGRRILEQLVFAIDTVDEICNTPDARTLPGSQKKALAFARAFLLNPNLYLMDRPEDAASDKLIRALTARMIQEKRLGRSFIVATEDRSILECCDQLLILQGGRVIEAGNAEEISGRMSAGWARMMAARNLDSEDNLDRWIRSHFKRDGDEANRRKTALIAAELLAFSCRSSSATEGLSVTFEFKHFEGHCILRLLDDDGPVTTAQLERARDEAERAEDGTRLSPLALVISKTTSVEAVMEGTKRVVIAKIATYDPRKTRAGKVTADATSAP